MFQEGSSFPVVEVGGLLAAGYSIYQSKQLHDIELARSRAHHEESIRLAEEQHKRNLAEVKRTYLLELFNNLEQHFQQLNADLIASSKESERDMFDQRNQSFQTIILASSVMFTALSTAMTNGLIPFQSSEVFVIGYSLTTSLSFSFLFLCVVVCIELVLRASSFMYRRAHKHTESLRDAIEKTKVMMRKLRARSREQSSWGDKDRRRADSVEFPDTTGIPQPAEKHSSKGGRSIVTMDDDTLQEEWVKHEIEIQNYLSERERINDATAVVVNSTEESTKKSFQQFWNESCKFWAELAILFFYAGTLNMLLSILIFLWTKFFLDYKSLISAIIAVALILLALVIGVAAVIIARIIKQSGASENHSPKRARQSSFTSADPSEFPPIPSETRSQSSSRGDSHDGGEGTNIFDQIRFRKFHNGAKPAVALPSLPPTAVKVTDIHGPIVEV